MSGNSLCVTVFIACHTFKRSVLHVYVSCTSKVSCLHVGERCTASREFLVVDDLAHLADGLHKVMRGISKKAAIL